MINYKSLSLFLLFSLCVSLGFTIEHDSYQVCFGIASVILATAVVFCFVNNRFFMLVLCIFFAVVFCQLSVVARTAVKDPGSRQNFNQQNPTGYLVGDIIHGFKRIKNIFNGGLSDGIAELKDGSYRYLSLAGAYFLISAPCIIGKKPATKLKREKRLRKR